MLIKRILNWDRGEQVAVFLDNNRYETDNRICFWKYSDCEIVFRDGEETLYRYEEGPEEISGEDIVTISSDGIVKKTRFVPGKEIDIFVTNKCNSNCIMCPVSESVRKKNNGQYNEWLIKYINALPEHVGYINITGGEPTLAGDFFLETVKMLRDKYPHTGFQILTNGRSVSDNNFLDKLIPILPKGVLFAIPLHSSKAEIHDRITRAEGSFIQTDAGIRNLIKKQQKIEIRIVLSNISIGSVYETALYIKENYRNIHSVNFVAMEMMGNAVINRDQIWIGYEDIFPRIKKAVDLLVRAGIDVKLYNFPLCMVGEGYWPIAAKSISEYKIQYSKGCEGCTVKEICGGFFGSTLHLMKPPVRPITKKN